MTETSGRFALPFILPGQAQKELFHNEAVALIDGLVHAAVEGAAVAAPPADPEVGQAWLVATAATGAFAGQDHALALRTAGGWRFVAPVPGMAVRDLAAGCVRHWTGSAWSDGAVEGSALRIDGLQVVGPRLADVATPSGGTTIDAEARTALTALIVAIRSHGLIG